MNSLIEQLITRGPVVTDGKPAKKATVTVKERENMRLVSKLLLTYTIIAALLAVNGSTPTALCAKAPQAVSLQIESPYAGESVKGQLLLKAKTDGLPLGCSIDFVLNMHSLGLPIRAAPFEMNLDTASLWDGPMRLQAIARNSKGKVIAQAPPVDFSIKNGSTTVQITSPQPDTRVRGKIRWEARATDPDKISLMSFYLDGRQLHLEEITPTSPYIGGFTFDTTRLANGTHELCVTAARTEDGSLPTAMHLIQVTVDNVHLPLSFRSKWREVFLRPREVTELTPRIVFTDGKEQGVSEAVTFTSRNPEVARVDAKGTLHAVAEGITEVTIKSLGMEASVRVTVTNQREFAHFARDGAILHQYDPKRSLWVRSMFFLSPEEIDRDPTLAREARTAGINALTTGLYSNPADNHNPDFATWRAGWSAYWAKCERVAKTNGFSLVCTGDDIARNSEEMRNTLENPWAGKAITFAFNTLRESRIGVCVEMQDEVGGPVSPEYRKVMDILNRIPNRVPITWPPAGLQSADVFKAWLGDPKMSDYCSLYWTYVVGAHQQAYPWGMSMEQTRQNLETIVWGRLPVLPLNRPKLFLSGACGQCYTKRVAGAYYQPGQDIPIINGLEPAGVSVTIMYGVALGMAGTRTYAYDAVWKREREAAPIGRRDLQTGTAPTGPTRERWDAMAATFNLIKTLEPHILQPQISALDLGGTIMTGARQGPRSRLLIAVNCSEARPRAHIDMRPFRYAEAKTVTCYRLTGSEMIKQVFPNLSEAEVTFAPGESIVWLFEPGVSKPH